MRNNQLSIRLSCFIVAAACSFAAFSTAGCDDGDGTGGGGGGEEPPCYDYSTFDGASPEVQFKADVLPIFQRSCGITTGCHGDAAAPDPKRPYLGPNQKTPATDDDIAIIRGGIIDVQSFYEPGMSIVTSGDPENSFLMYKLDFPAGKPSITCDKLECASVKDCGSPMPQGNEDPLDKAERDTIRRWIAQGALDN